MEDQPSLIERLRIAREEKDLEKLHLIVNEVERIGTDIPVSELCSVVSDIGSLKGYLQNSDSRGWKKSGKTTREDLIIACRRALRALIGDCQEPSRIQDRPAELIRHRKKRRVRVF